MRTFEVGKFYEYGAIVYKVIARSAKFVTVEELQHFGSYNERVTDTKRLKVNNWEGREVFFDNYNFWFDHVLIKEFRQSKTVGTIYSITGL